MPDDRTLQLLCCELSFLRNGGYGHRFRSNWRPTLIFRDSPLCLNFEPNAPAQPCERCWLFPFVPEDRREALMPCHHIPLNEQRETIASIYRDGTQEQMDKAVQQWLQATIERLAREENSNERS